MITSGADGRLEVLLLTGGHAFDREPLLAAWQSDPGFHVTHTEHPAATDAIADGRAAKFDTVVSYDMLGVDPRGPAKPERLPQGVREGFEEMMGRGTGLVFLHQALASWPAWEGYAELVGGRYHFWPGTLRGTHWPDSGYRHDTPHRISVLAQDHPVTRGVERWFPPRDEPDRLHPARCRRLGLWQRQYTKTVVQRCALGGQAAVTRRCGCGALRRFVLRGVRPCRT
jgi:hypothetical protein